MNSLLDKVVETVRAHRDGIEQRYGLRLVGVVGSVARGEEGPESDIDLMFDVSGGTSLFKMARAQFELEDALGRNVDLVDREGLRPAARAYIERDLVLA